MALQIKQGNVWKQARNVHSMQDDPVFGTTTITLQHTADLDLNRLSAAGCRLRWRQGHQMRVGVIKSVFVNVGAGTVRLIVEPQAL